MVHPTFAAGRVGVRLLRFGSDSVAQAGRDGCLGRPGPSGEEAGWWLGGSLLGVERVGWEVYGVVSRLKKEDNTINWTKRVSEWVGGGARVTRQLYGIMVSFWGSGTLKIVIYVKNNPQKRSFRSDDYHPPLGWWGLLAV